MNTLSIIAYLIILIIPLFTSYVLNSDLVVLRIFVLMLVSNVLILAYIHRLCVRRVRINLIWEDFFLITLFLITLVNTMGRQTHLTVQTLVHPINGVLTLFTMTVIYFFLSRAQRKYAPTNLLIYLILSVATLTTIYFTAQRESYLFTPLAYNVQLLRQQCSNITPCLFGLGIDNTHIFFPHVKNIEYVHSVHWGTSTFQYSTALITQLIAELGLTSLLAFLFLFPMLHLSWNKRKIVILAVFVPILLLPPMFESLFILVLLISITTDNENREREGVVTIGKYRLLLISALTLLFALWGFVQTTHLLIAEFTYAQSLKPRYQKDISARYTLQKQALGYRSDVLKYHLGFIQTNRMLIAAYNAKYTHTSHSITKEDKQVISQAVQTIVKELQNIIQIEPQNANNIAYVGEIYSSLIPSTTQARAWSIASFDRAIELDPYNLPIIEKATSDMFKAKEYTQSLVYAHRYLSLRKDHSPIYLLIAQNFLELGKKDEANQTLHFIQDSMKNISEREKYHISNLLKRAK